MKRNTKNKILNTASAVFAEKGFRGATVREICNRAGVNLASVNYYFSSKSFLYEKVFEYLFTKTDVQASVDINLNIDTESDWHREIKSFLYRMMRRFTSGDKYERYLQSLFAWEEINPSKHFSGIYAKILSPRLNDIKKLFSYGNIKSETELNICVLSIVSIFLQFAGRQSLTTELTGNPNFGAENIDLIVENIFAGITASIKYRK